MEKIEILSKVQEIFRDILDNEDIVLSEESTAMDIEEWDSLSNIQVVHEVECEFSIRFTSEEIPSWKNVGDMIECIIKHT